MTDETQKFALQADQLKSDMSDLSRLADSLGQRLVNAFAGAVIHGRKFSDVLRGIGLSLAQTSLTAALRPLGNLLGGLFGNITGSAKGNIFTAAGITPFAKGGIVNAPTLFPFRNGTGLMGEAGPEAILPLARGADGRLGVRQQGVGSTVVNVTISTPDIDGFQRSQSQIAASLARAVARGQRNG